MGRHPTKRIAAACGNNHHPVCSSTTHLRASAANGKTTQKTTATSRRPSKGAAAAAATAKPPKNGGGGKRKHTTTRRKSPPSKQTRYQMLNHEILTAQEEQLLGRKLQRAMQAKESMAKLLEQKRMEQPQQSKDDNGDDGDFLQQMTEDLLFRTSPPMDDYDNDDQEDLAGLSIYGMDSNRMMEMERASLSAGSNYYSRMDTDIDIESEELELWDLADDRPEFEETLIPSLLQQNTNKASTSTNKKLIDDSFLPDDLVLTEQDIIETLGIPGGRDELTRILIHGALARDKIISSNIRLVVSIAKKWFHQSNSNPGEMANDSRLASMYAGSWTKPSLDEVIQEGILGLATAANRFEPERKLKFGTYATYWITSYVRLCFQRAATGCLRIPPHYHVQKQKYQTIVKHIYRETGESPSIEEVAKEMGLTTHRLKFILKSTQPIASIDAPATTGSLPGQGGKAGGEMAGDDNSLLLENLLSW